MASNGSKVAGLFWVLGYLISISGSVLVLCGLASMQNLCHTDGPIITNSRKLLQMDADVVAAACSKAYRFQWWGWALQTTFLLWVAIYWAAGFKHNGVMIMGGTITVLAMVFANDQLQASDDVGGKAFSRATLTFVGWLLSATGNYLLLLAFDHLEDKREGSCGGGGGNGAAKGSTAASGAATTDVSATTA